MARRILLLTILLAGCGGPPAPKPPPVEPPPPPGPPQVTATGATLVEQHTGTTQRLQAVSVVSEKVVWASGTGGTWVATKDGGIVWRNGVVPGADSLEFRDVHGVDAKTAYLLSAGPGVRSRIYKTTDGGVNWQIQFINRQPEAFYDCFAFWDPKSGIAFSDAVNGKFPAQYTDDGGQRWEQLTTLPPATKGEGAFAASGTCVITLGKNAAWVATGAGEQARLLHTPDRGKSWSSVATPIAQGTPTSGHTSVAFRSERDGIAVGGDIGDANRESDNVVITADAGRSWIVGGRATFSGAIFGAVYVPGTPRTAVAVGPKGASFSTDDGRTWLALDSLNYWSAGFASRTAGWLVGTDGRVTRVALP